MRVVIIGGGVLGTMHAWHAIARGHDVVHLEREVEARGATVRNFGLVWISGRSDDELAATLRSRELWEEVGAAIPAVGFRACGSLTIAQTDAEVAVLAEAADRPGATERGFTLLSPDKARARNPALRGEFAAALWCDRDAAVESRVTLPAIRAHLAAGGRYAFVGGAEAVDVTPAGHGGRVRDAAGTTYDGDVVILCPGVRVGGLTRAVAGELPVRPVRLQMMQTAPLGESLTTALADADSLRYYPAFAGPALDALTTTQPQDPFVLEHRIQLLCMQRLGGGLTIGDTHGYVEPFPFDVDEAPYEHLRRVVEGLLGRPLPPIVKRWAGVYAQATTDGALCHRAEPSPGVWVVTGPGGRGMTLGPVIGEMTADEAGL